jgi:serine-type D-Ala-D-Ala carboxypeptidase
MSDAAVVAEDLVARHVAPQAAAGCAARAKGSPDRFAEEVGGDTSAFFDLASVTKPMTAVAVVRAGIDPGTPLGALLPEARGTASEGAPLELLLAHRAGLAAHRPLYAPLVRGEVIDVRAALREAAGARRPETALAPGAPWPAEGFAPLYSDLGYALAGEALAKATGARDAGEAIERLVLAPLGLLDRAGTARGLASRPGAGAMRFAPTEDVPWRGGRVSGAVHDENAWALTGLGGSGHAGIFGTVGAVVAFGVAVLEGLEGRGPLGDRPMEWLVRERPGGTLRAGFDGKSPEGSSAGARFGPRSFGHLGFTGTSLWIDPDAAVIAALLTNRVCPSREHVAIREARPQAHDALWNRAVLLRGRD